MEKNRRSRSSTVRWMVETYEFDQTDEGLFGFVFFSVMVPSVFYKLQERRRK